MTGSNIPIWNLLKNKIVYKNIELKHFISDRDEEVACLWPKICPPGLMYF